MWACSRSPSSCSRCRYLTARVTIPVIVDADTGFGDTANVERTIAELERAGAAAIQLEDQELPKRCGHLSGKSLVTTDAMCAKLRAAAAAARADDDTVIIARTDARGVEGFDAAVERAKQYVDAGADWIFPEALATREEFQAFAKAIDVPLVANMTEFGKSPLLDFDELARDGLPRRALSGYAAAGRDEGRRVDAARSSPPTARSANCWT